MHASRLSNVRPIIDANIPRKALHRHITRECPFRRITCTSCKSLVPWKDLSLHKTMECLERLQTCPFLRYGCHERVKFKDLVAHIDQNEIKHLSMKCAFLDKENAALKRAPKKVSATFVPQRNTTSSRIRRPRLSQAHRLGVKKNKTPELTSL